MCIADMQQSLKGVFTKSKGASIFCELSFTDTSRP